MNNNWCGFNNNNRRGHGGRSRPFIPRGRGRGGRERGYPWGQNGKWIWNSGYKRFPPHQNAYFENPSGSRNFSPNALYNNNNKTDYERPASPLPGSEEYTQRNIQQTSDLIKRQLSMNVDSDDLLLNMGRAVPDDSLTIRNKQNNTDNDNEQSNASVSNAITKKAKIKLKRPSQSIDVSEIHDKIIKHISNLSHKGKINLVNRGREGYDFAIHQIQTQKRLELSRALRDMCNKSTQDSADCEVINAIIPDIGIKIEDLPREVIAKLSSTLDIEFQCNRVDPDECFKEAQRLLTFDEFLAIDSTKCNEVDLDLQEKNKLLTTQTDFLPNDGFILDERELLRNQNDYVNQVDFIPEQNDCYTYNHDFFPNQNDDSFQLDEFNPYSFNPQDAMQPIEVKPDKTLTMSDDKLFPTKNLQSDDPENMFSSMNFNTTNSYLPPVNKEKNPFIVVNSEKKIEKPVVTKQKIKLNRTRIYSVNDSDDNLKPKKHVSKITKPDNQSASILCLPITKPNIISIPDEEMDDRVTPWVEAVTNEMALNSPNLNESKLSPFSSCEPVKNEDCPIDAHLVNNMNEIRPESNFIETENLNDKQHKQHKEPRSNSVEASRRMDDAKRNCFKNGSYNREGSGRMKKSGVSENHRRRRTTRFNNERRSFGSDLEIDEPQDSSNKTTEKPPRLDRSGESDKSLENKNIMGDKSEKRVIKDKSEYITNFKIPKLVDGKKNEEIKSSKKSLKINEQEKTSTEKPHEKEKTKCDASTSSKSKGQLKQAFKPNNNKTYNIDEDLDYEISSCSSDHTDRISCPEKNKSLTVSAEVLTETSNEADEVKLSPEISSNAKKTSQMNNENKAQEETIVVLKYIDEFNKQMDKSGSRKSRSLEREAPKKAENRRFKSMERVDDSLPQIEQMENIKKLIEATNIKSEAEVIVQVPCDIEPISNLPIVKDAIPKINDDITKNNISISSHESTSKKATDDIILNNSKKTIEKRKGKSIESHKKDNSKKETHKHSKDTHRTDLKSTHHKSLKPNKHESQRAVTAKKDDSKLKSKSSVKNPERPHSRQKILPVEAATSKISDEKEIKENVKRKRKSSSNEDTVPSSKIAKLNARAFKSNETQTEPLIETKQEEVEVTGSKLKTIECLQAIQDIDTEIAALQTKRSALLNELLQNIVQIPYPTPAMVLHPLTKLLPSDPLPPIPSLDEIIPKEAPEVPEEPKVPEVIAESNSDKKTKKNKDIQSNETREGRNHLRAPTAKRKKSLEPKEVVKPSTTRKKSETREICSTEADNALLKGPTLRAKLPYKKPMKQLKYTSTVDETIDTVVRNFTVELTELGYPSPKIQHPESEQDENPLNLKELRVNIIRYDQQELEKLIAGSMKITPSDEFKTETNEEPNVTFPVNDVQFEGWIGSILAIKVINNKIVLAGNDKGTFYFFQLFTGKLQQSITLSQKPITSICIIKHDKHTSSIYVGSLGATVHVINYNEEKNEVYKVINIDEPVQCMESSWGYIFIGSHKGNLIRYNVTKEKIEDSVAISSTNVLVLRATQEGCRRVLLVATRSAPVTVRDAMTGLLMRTMEGTLNPTVYTLLYHNNHVYCGTSQHDVLVYTFQDGQLMFKHEQSNTSGVVCMTIVKNLLFVGCYNGNIYVYNTNTNEFITSMPGPGGLFLSMEVVGNMIIAGTKQNHFKAWILPANIMLQITD